MNDTPYPSMVFREQRELLAALAEALGEHPDSVRHESMEFGTDDGPMFGTARLAFADRVTFEVHLPAAHAVELAHMLTALHDRITEHPSRPALAPSPSPPKAHTVTDTHPHADHPEHGNPDRDAEQAFANGLLAADMIADTIAIGHTVEPPLDTAFPGTGQLVRVLRVEVETSRAPVTPAHRAGRALDKPPAVRVRVLLVPRRRSGDGAPRRNSPPEWVVVSDSLAEMLLRHPALALAGNTDPASFVDGPTAKPLHGRIIGDS